MPRSWPRPESRHEDAGSDPLFAMLEHAVASPLRLLQQPARQCAATLRLRASEGQCRVLRVDG